MGREVGREAGAALVRAVGRDVGREVGREAGGVRAAFHRFRKRALLACTSGAVSAFHDVGRGMVRSSAAGSEPSNHKAWRWISGCVEDSCRDNAAGMLVACLI